MTLSRVGDAAAMLPRALGADPDLRLKRQRVLYRAIMLIGFEAEMASDRARAYAAWAEAGCPVPAPASLQPLSRREREYALKAWRTFLAWLRQLEVEPFELDQRPEPRAQRDRKRLRGDAEEAIRALGNPPTDIQRAAAMRAVAAFRSTDPAPGDGVRRHQRAAVAYEARASGDFEVSCDKYPHLRPRALRASLASPEPLPADVGDALRRLEGFDPDRAKRLRDDPRTAREEDLAWLVAQTETAWQEGGLPYVAEG